MFNCSSVVNVDTEKRSVILKDPSVHGAVLMVSTFGGSLNGSAVHFEFQPFG